MSIIRTPDERFVNLPDFPFPPRYVEINGLRVHYIDEGRGETILCLHGEPTWSFLFRKAIRALSTRYRVVAMDFIGFGRSDKFAAAEEYSFHLHHAMLSGFLDVLKLDRITLVGHDGGAVYGLWAASERPERFSRLVIMNTDLPTGDQPTNTMFEVWRNFVRIEPDVPIPIVIKSALAHGYKIPDNVIAAYEAPFPDSSCKSGAATWPFLVPTRPDAPGAAEMRRTREMLARWDKPAFVLFSEEDPIYAGKHVYFRDLIPAAKAQPEIVIQKAGHFLLEEKGEEVTRHIMNFVARTPSP